MGVVLMWLLFCCVRVVVEAGEGGELLLLLLVVWLFGVGDFCGVELPSCGALVGVVLVGLFNCARVAVSGVIVKLGVSAASGRVLKFRSRSSSRVSGCRRPESIHVFLKVSVGGSFGVQLSYRMAITFSSALAWSKRARARTFMR